MKNLKQNLFQIAKIIILFLMISFGSGYVFAQWSAPMPGSVLAPSGNRSLPLNTSVTPQVKDGPLLLNASNITPIVPTIPGLLPFGLYVPYKGILLGAIDPTVISGTLGLLHIHNSGAGLAIRVDGAGPALVTDSATARIGIGTLTPEYSIDIPGNNAAVRIGGGPLPPGVALQVEGGVAISADTPNQGDVLTSINNEGEAAWTPITIAPQLAPTNSNPLAREYIDARNENGIANLSFPNLRNGLWRVTVYGTTAFGPVDGNQVVTVSINNENKSFHLGNNNPSLGNNPDGNAPFSVSKVIYIGGGQLTVSVSDNISGAPLINGVAAYLLGV